MEYFYIVVLVHLLILKGVSAISTIANTKTKHFCVETSLVLFNGNIMYASFFPSPRASPPLVKKKKSAAGCWLPWWCVFLGWFLLLSISGVSTFFTLLYGFEYGREKSIKWVMSLGLSLFQSIFILQPLKVCENWKKETIQIIHPNKSLNLAFSLKTVVSRRSN